MTNIDLLFAIYREALQNKEKADKNYEHARERLQQALDGPSTPSLDRNPVAETWAVGSRTRLGTRHNLTRYADGNVTCTCEGFKFRKNCGHGGRVVGPTRENGTALSVPA